MNSGISAGGELRLRKAIEAEVRKQYQAELETTLDHSQRKEIEDKIKREIKTRMRALASPYSLWNSC